jgi:type IV secretion system protein VirB8
VLGCFDAHAVGAPVIQSSELGEYFKKARRFDQDAAISALKSRRIAWITASAMGGLAVCATLAVAMLAPLKTVEPFVIRVDNATGIVDVVSPLRGSNTYQEAVTKYWAGLYVRSREGFTYSEVGPNFKLVALMSTEAEQQRYAAAFGPKNPESPQVLYGRAATAKIAIKSISMIAKDVASVRYSRTVTRGEEQRVTHWVATLTYAYVAAAMSEGDRLINPLGFQVSEYRADGETHQ